MYYIHDVPGMNDNSDPQYYYWPSANTKTFPLFKFYGSVHRKCIPIYIQKDARLHSLFISDNFSTRFVCTSTHHQEHIQLYLPDAVDRVVCS
jgi:hypothetical protein